jgi:hypothetical protein
MKTLDIGGISFFLRQDDTTCCGNLNVLAIDVSKPSTFLLNSYMNKKERLFDLLYDNETKPDKQVKVIVDTNQKMSDHHPIIGTFNIEYSLASGGYNKHIKLKKYSKTYKKQNNKKKKNNIKTKTHKKKKNNTKKNLIKK